MPDIKTRDTVKGTIKTLDKAAIAGERMKEAYVRTKEKAEHGVYSAESSPEEYAADRFSGGTETVTYEAAHQFDKQGRKGVQATRENISKAKEHCPLFWGTLCSCRSSISSPHCDHSQSLRNGGHGHNSIFYWEKSWDTFG